MYIPLFEALRCKERVFTRKQIHDYNVDCKITDHANQVITLFLLLYSHSNYIQLQSSLYICIYCSHALIIFSNNIAFIVYIVHIPKQISVEFLCFNS